MSSLHERNYPSAPKKKRSKMDLLVRHSHGPLDGRHPCRLSHPIIH